CFSGHLRQKVVTIELLPFQSKKNVARQELARIGADAQNRLLRGAVDQFSGTGCNEVTDRARLHYEVPPPIPESRNRRAGSRRLAKQFPSSGKPSTTASSNSMDGAMAFRPDCEPG